MLREGVDSASTSVDSDEASPGVGTGLCHCVGEVTTGEVAMASLGSGEEGDSGSGLVAPTLVPGVILEAGVTSLPAVASEGSRVLIILFPPGCEVVLGPKLVSVT